MTSRRVILSLAIAAAVTAAAQVPDLSGTWRLNVEKSTWGKHPKPTGGSVTIEHHEPAFKYSGLVEIQKDPETPSGTSFWFDGAIDGKPYPIKGAAGAGNMTIRRVNPTTTISEWKSTDGSLVETARMTISRDGKQLTREIKAHAAGKDLSWTDVYDRQ